MEFLKAVCIDGTLPGTQAAPLETNTVGLGQHWEVDR